MYDAAQPLPARQPSLLSGAIAGHSALRFDQARIVATNTTANLVESGSPRTILIVGKAKTRPNGVGGTLFTFRRSTAGRTTVFTTQQWSAQPHYVYSDGIGTNTTIPALANWQSVEFEDSTWPAAIALGGDTASPWAALAAPPVAAPCRWLRRPGWSRFAKRSSTSTSCSTSTSDFVRQHF